MFWTKPCRKPKWREFEDTDDERDYKKKLLKYRAWKYSLFSNKNVVFDRPNSPLKKTERERETGDTPAGSKPKANFKMMMQEANER